MNTSLISLTKSLIQIPSVKGNSDELKQVLQLAKTQLKGYTIEEFESNGILSLLAYTRKKRPEKFKIILNAHLDVVPGRQEQFNPIQKDGKLYGRGAYDMKSAAAAMIFIFKELAKKINYPLGLQLVTDEEIGGANGTKYQVQKGVKADFVVAGENSNFAIRNEAKGVLWIKIRTRGTAAHGAYPWLGDNALKKALLVIKRIENIFPNPRKDAWVTTANLAKIETTNQTFNKVPSDANVWFDIRYIPKDGKMLLSKIKQVLPKTTVIEVVTHEPAAYTDVMNVYLQLLTKTIETTIGQKPKIYGAHGASDVRFYTNAGGAGVEFGIIGAGHHADNECVEIESLEAYYEVLKEFLLAI